MPYTIQPGDTLSALARRFNTTVSRLVELNGIPNPDLIYAGASLRIPQDENGVSPASSSPRGTSALSLPASPLPSRPPDLTGLVESVYRSELGRPSDPDGLAGWSAHASDLRAQGQTEAAIREALVAAFRLSPEYRDQHPLPVGLAPHISQYHPDGQQEGYTNGASNCGPTSMAMIARAFGYGAGMSEAQLINQLGGFGGTGPGGTGVNGIGAMAEAIGLRSETRGPGADIAFIADALQRGMKVVANGDYYALPPHAGPVGSGGHYVAVVGMAEDGRFLVNDPADDAINGRPFTADELARFISSNANGGYAIAVG